MHHQFLLHVFWTSFLPKLEKIWAEANEEQLKGIVSSFPYDRWEVEQTLLQFRDAGGTLTHFEKRAKFKQCCCCEEKDGKKKCSLKGTKDLNCERPAVLLRKDLTLETTMTERKRRQIEEERIDQAIEAATKTTKIYLNSDEGRDEVRALAEDRIDARKNSTSQKMEVKRRSHISSPVSKHKNAIGLLMECLPQKRREEREIREEMLRIQDEIISEEVDSRRKRAVEVNKKLRMVLKAWLGLTTEDVFSGWKHLVYELKIQRLTDEQTRNEEQNRLHLESKEKERMAMNEVRVFVKLHELLLANHVICTNNLCFSLFRLVTIMGKKVGYLSGHPVLAACID